MLESGTKVKIKSREEINKTLDSDNTCNRVIFNHNMYALCGQTLTLTAHFDNGAYSSKESFYNWRPELFDVIEDYEDFQESIWSGSLKDKMLNLAMLHQVESGKGLNLSLLKKYIAEYNCFPAENQGGFDYDDYSSEKWKLSHWWCESPPDYKWLNLKPEFVEKIILRAKSENRLYKLKESHDNPLTWFTWKDAPEGTNYWSDFAKLYTQDTQTLTNTTQNERNKIKLQRKKTSIRVGTVPEGCRVYGKRCKTSVRSRHLSYTTRIGY